MDTLTNPSRRLVVSGILFILVAVPLCAQTAAQVWVAYYDGPGGGEDDASSMAMDGAGNIVVTGQSVGNGTGLDFYTAKYAGLDGHLLWEHRYNGPGNSVDRGNAVAVDGAGNVVVTGGSIGAGTGYDFYTAKYAAADGALLWEQRYNGTGNGTDEGIRVAVDAAGDVVVGGYAMGLNFVTYAYTAKYAGADGHLLWERRYNDPANVEDMITGLALDRAGNAVVAVYSHNASNIDFYTAKYAAADGALLWEQRYNGPANGDDVISAVAVDGAGNVVVTGQSESATQYVYEAYTAKYAAADGHLLWEYRYPHATSSSNGRVLALDGAGNVAVTGSFSVQYGTGRVYTAKYDATDGHPLWEQHFAPGQHALLEIDCLAVDNAGNVAISGAVGVDLMLGSFDVYTAKYAAADGHLLWEATYNGPANNADYGYALVLTPDGGAVFAGTSSPTGETEAYDDFATVRYTPPVTTFAQWKLARLGDLAAPDDGDPDRDGLGNLLEYALGTDPLARTVLPAGSTADGRSTLTFPRIATATDVILTVQGSDDLASWTDLARSTGGAAMVALVAGVTVTETGVGPLHTVEVGDLYNVGDPAHPQRFLRLQATAIATPAAPALKIQTSPVRHRRRR